MLQCSVPLANLLACHRSLRVHWIMFTLYLQWHHSAFRGQCTVTASPRQCLTWSPISGLCVFTTVPSHHSSAGPLSYPPQATALSKILHFCPWCSFIFISYARSNPATPQYDCVSFFGLCEVSLSSFPAVHQLWSVTGLHKFIMSKTSACLWKSGDCYLHEDFILHDCLSLKDFYANFCFSLILSCFNMTLSLRNCSPKAGKARLQLGTKVCSLEDLHYF